MVGWCLGVPGEQGQRYNGVMDRRAAGCSSETEQQVPDWSPGVGLLLGLLLPVDALLHRARVLVLVPSTQSNLLGVEMSLSVAFWASGREMSLVPWGVFRSGRQSRASATASTHSI
jgi:hypothetical protein